MATRIRLQRRGKKNQPFYHLVIADGRAPRDGRFIEDLGTYNPLTNPATLNINFDRALYWLEAGAAPSDTARSILKREGVYMMKHLRGGVAKGAFSEAEAQKRFEAWKQEKESKLNNVAVEEKNKKRAVVKERLAAEVKVKEAMSAKIAARNAEIAAAEAKAAQEAAEAAAAEAAAEAAEATAEEVPAAEADAPAAEETPAEA
ncbi:MAG: 30S ribosomal protein S16 [Bacteroidales bacterium]|nr:30S ribosomal protein S16 [Bacteroidales bacterium]